MDDPSKMLEAQMAETNEILTLRASVNEGQRLLNIALKQRNTARAMESLLRHDLNSVYNHWAFFFLPRWLKNEIHRVLNP